MLGNQQAPHLLAAQNRRELNLNLLAAIFASKSDLQNLRQTS